MMTFWLCREPCGLYTAMYFSELPGDGSPDDPVLAALALQHGAEGARETFESISAVLKTSLLASEDSSCERHLDLKSAALLFEDILEYGERSIGPGFPCRLIIPVISDGTAVSGCRYFEDPGILDGGTLDLRELLRRPDQLEDLFPVPGLVTSCASAQGSGRDLLLSLVRHPCEINLFAWTGERRGESADPELAHRLLALAGCGDPDAVTEVRFDRCAGAAQRLMSGKKLSFKGEGFTKAEMPCICACAVQEECDRRLKAVKPDYDALQMRERAACFVSALKLYGELVRSSVKDRTDFGLQARGIRLLADQAALRFDGKMIAQKQRAARPALSRGRGIA